MIALLPAIAIADRADKTAEAAEQVGQAASSQAPATAFSPDQDPKLPFTMTLADGRSGLKPEVRLNGIE
jgi:hypothetical protein